MTKRSSSYGTSQELPSWAQLLFIIFILGILAWVFIIQPLIEWVNQNILLIGVVFLGIVILILIIAYLLWKREEKQMEEKRRLEQDYRSQGLVKYFRKGTELWGTPEQIKIWKKEDEKAELVNHVADSIKEYRPPKPLRDEYAYQMGLHGFLENEFRGTRVEVRRGRSRPDLVIGDIAIEVKGPTDNMALVTISDKAMRYMQHFKYLIVVLFEPRFNQARYQEWFRGMERTYPNVIIIKKDRSM